MKKFPILFSVILFLLGALTWSCQENYKEEGEDLIGRVMGRFQQEYEMTKDPATGRVPRERLLKALQIAQSRRAKMGQKSGIIPIYWSERGPNNVGGRTRALIFDAGDPARNTVWAGGVSGGLWRTADIDASPVVWTNINDYFSNLAITTIAQDPTNANVFYFGTGENGFGNFDAVSGMGIWQSIDGGANWNQLATTLPFRSVNKILVNNTGTVFAATSIGLFRSSNPAVGPWVKILGVGSSATQDNVQDIEFATNGNLYAAINSDGVYRFRNNVWTKLAGGLPANGYNRIELATAPNNANVVYSAFESAGNCTGVYVTLDGGNNWNLRTIPVNTGGQTWYNFIMAVDPNNFSRVWLGAVGLSVSSDMGNSWTAIGGVHSDHHAVVYRPGNSDEMIFGNDGGVYRSTDGSMPAPTLIQKNDGYNVTQYYANAIHPAAGSNNMLAGSQDNGTQRYNCAGICATTLATGADGAYCFIDQDNPNIQITASQNRVFNLATDGVTFNNLIGGKPSTLFIAPADYDDAANVLYMSDGIDSLGRITDIGGTNTITFDSITELRKGVISALTVSPNVANRLYIGASNGRMLRINNAHLAGATLVDTLNSPEPSWVSSIAVQTGNDNHLLATFSSYGVNSVWETTDGGANWINVEGDLPDMPVRWGMFHPFAPDQALLATELGVWTTDDIDGTNTEWFPTNTYGLANVRVDMLQFRSSDNLVAAATHGRGMFTTDYFGLLEGCAPAQNLSGSISPGLYLAENTITSDGTVASGRSVIFHAGLSITLTPNFRADPGSFFLAAIQDCGPPGALKAPLSENSKADADPYGQGIFQRPKMVCQPNPANYYMHIKAYIPDGDWYGLEIRNLQGMLLETPATPKSQETYFEYELDAGSYAPGMYLLILRTKKETITERFLVVK